jgi:hypothetical protein
MKRNARNAFNALKKIGAPVLDPELGWGGHFGISAELAGRDDWLYPGSKDLAPGGYWADYYGEFTGFYPYVAPEIEKILDKYDLYYEWVNAAVLGVYDA